MRINVILKCTECGTLIFTYEDYRYEPNLKCPTCTDYKTNFDFWTKKDIESDDGKKATLKAYEELKEREKEIEERIKRRNGKYDWQIAIKKIYTKKKLLVLNLECNDITESYFKGLRLTIEVCVKDYENNMYFLKKNYIIPLSWSAFYYQFIYKIKDPVDE